MNEQEIQREERQLQRCQHDIWHVALNMIIEPYGPVIYQITLLQKQQINACFPSPMRVYNELNIEKIDIDFTLILASLQIKQFTTSMYFLMLLMFCLFGKWLVTSRNPVYPLHLADFLYFHAHLFFFKDFIFILCSPALNLHLFLQLQRYSEALTSPQYPKSFSSLKLNIHQKRDAVSFGSLS